MRRLPDTYVQSRDALHRVAVYVMWPARTAADGKIRLRPTPGGFGFGPVGDAQLGVRVDGTDLVVTRGAQGKRSALSTLAGAAAFVDIAPGLDAAEKYDVPAPGDLDVPLAIDPEGASALAGWFAFAGDILATLHGEARPEDAPSEEVVLWPEHFDCAFDQGREEDGKRATYGMSPGDRNSAEPYLYVGPWVKPSEDPFWNAVGFSGRWLKRSELGPDATAEALAFFREARGRLLDV